MAKIRESRASFEAELKSVLADGLRKSGIEPTIGFQRVPMTKLVRVMVTAPQFRKMMPSERQDLVWRIVSQRFTPDQQLLISMILALLPEDPVRTGIARSYFRKSKEGNRSPARFGMAKAALAGKKSN